MVIYRLEITIKSYLWYNYSEITVGHYGEYRDILSQLVMDENGLPNILNGKLVNLSQLTIASGKSWWCMQECKS